jgi:hypothetical protein
VTLSIEKYRVVVEIGGTRYLIMRELRFAGQVYSRLTDRGPVSLTAEERARLEPVAQAFDAASEAVGKS